MVATAADNGETGTFYYILVWQWKERKQATAAAEAAASSKVNVVRFFLSPTFFTLYNTNSHFASFIHLPLLLLSKQERKRRKKVLPLFRHTFVSFSCWWKVNCCLNEVLYCTVLAIIQCPLLWLTDICHLCLCCSGEEEGGTPSLAPSGEPIWRPLGNTLVVFHSRFGGGGGDQEQNNAPVSRNGIKINRI